MSWCPLVSASQMHLVPFTSFHYDLPCWCSLFEHGWHTFHSTRCLHRNCLRLKLVEVDGKELEAQTGCLAHVNFIIAGGEASHVYHPQPLRFESSSGIHSGHFGSRSINYQLLCQKGLVDNEPRWWRRGARLLGMRVTEGPNVGLGRKADESRILIEVTQRTWPCSLWCFLYLRWSWTW